MSIETLNRARSPFHVLCKPNGPVCNIKCAYCFYLEKIGLFPDHTKASEFRMTDEVLENFTRQYIACQPPEAPEINFAWQGGEPTLMGIDFFRKALEYQKKYAREGQNITNALQTNGTLIDDEWAAFLAENDFLVGISIDGPEKLHNRYRLTRDGKGTFGMAMRGVEALRKAKAEFNTLTVIQNDNGSHPKEVYTFLKEIGSTYLQFIPIVEPEVHGVSNRSVHPRQWGTFLNAVFDIWRKGDIGKVFVQQFDVTLGIAMGYQASLCVQSPVCGRAVAIEHNGNLYSCDHFVNDADLLGNIAQRSLTEMIDGEKQTGFGQDKYRKLPRQCRECRYLKFCYGGCPSDRVKKDKYGEPGLNNSCEGYYRFFEYTEPYFRAMAAALNQQMPASEYPRFMPPPAAAQGSGTVKVGRNDPCPCGSGKKYKVCCGR